MKSVMIHDFSKVPPPLVQRSTFDRSCGRKLSLNGGYLVPFMVDEVIPGDTFKVTSTIFARMVTQVAPVMDNSWLTTFFFYVPYRLLWSNYKKFLGEKNPADLSTTYQTPYIVSPASTGFDELGLYDYLGLPTKVPGLTINNWHARAYNLIWNTCMKDQNLSADITVDLGDGPDTYTNYNPLRRRMKRPDYFTSCLPWPQKNATSVSLPLGTTAPVLGIGKTDTSYGASGSVNTTQGAVSWAAYGGANIVMQGQTSGALAGMPAVYADLTNATAATINQIRQAFQLQIMFERDARGGTRYPEIIFSHFGVRVPDFRCQRPEYLGGGVQRVTVTPIAQTSVTATTPQAHLAAMATVSAHGHGFVKSFVEGGVIIGLCEISADQTYQNGIDKMFLRRTREDYYFPALAHLGEQSVLTKEIYAQGTGHEADDESVFGYQERWAEYRYGISHICGKLRANATGTLDYWTLSQRLTSKPTLSEAFVQSDPPFDRVSAVPSEPHFVMDVLIENKCTRCMPVYSVPGLVDHY